MLPTVWAAGAVDLRRACGATSPPAAGSAPWRSTGRAGTARRRATAPRSVRTVAQQRFPHRRPGSGSPAPPARCCAARSPTSWSCRRPSTATSGGPWSTAPAAYRHTRSTRSTHPRAGPAGAGRRPATLLAGPRPGAGRGDRRALAAASAPAGRPGASTPPPPTPATAGQFGRPIGQFQAVKHRCADMLVALEQARAVAWDAAAALDGDDAGSGPPWRCRRRCRRPRGLRHRRQGLHPGARRHRLHLGARRPPLPPPGAGAPPAVRRRRPVAGGAAAAGWAAPAGTSAVDLPPEAEAPRARSGRRSRDRRPPQRRAAAPAGRHRAPGPALGAALGRGAGAVEQLVIDQELRRARVRVPHLQVGGVGRPDHRRPRHARAAGALGPPDPARRDHLVPAVQRAGGRLRPGVAHHHRHPRRRRLAPRRPEGVDHDGRRGRLGHLPGPHQPRRRPSTWASPTSSST